MSLSIKNLNLKIDAHAIFSGVNLDLVRGGFHSIVGPSGAGKTQLLRTLANLNTKYQNSPITEKCSLVFQNANLIPWLSAYKNVEITSNLKAKELSQMFQDFDLETFCNHRPFQISGGMQQRVSLIRAFASQSPIMFFDEAFSHLDLVNKRKNQNYLMNFWVKHKPTVLYVTHDVDEALLLSEKIFFFSKTKKTITSQFEINKPYPRSADLIYTDFDLQQIRKQIVSLYESDFQNEIDA